MSQHKPAGDPRAGIRGGPDLPAHGGAEALVAAGYPHGRRAPQLPLMQ